MLDSFKRIIGLGSAQDRLKDVAMEEQVAVCAILLEVAEADNHFADEEREEILRGLQNYFGLSKAAVATLMMTAEKERQNTADMWEFTNSISRSYSPDQKLNLLTMVWQVILADGVLDPHEEHLARRFQTMLSVNHSVLMEAKQKAREVMEARG